MPQTISLDQIMSTRAFSIGRTANGAEAIFKITKAPASWDAEARSARYVMSSQAVDRYGDVVETKGGNLAEFVKNPVVLFAHNSRGFPIGLWSDVNVQEKTRPPRMEGTASFSPEGTTPEADMAAKLVAAGIMRACSIGFMPTAWESIKDDQDRWTGYRFKEWELLECSTCSVPAHPHALVKSAGGDERLALQAIELVLDEWARTPDGLIVPRSEYERAYSRTRNKDVTVHEVRAIEEAAPAPTVDADMITRAVEAAISSESLLEKIGRMFGLTKAAPVVEPVVVPVVEPATPAVEERTAPEPELADEQEVLALRMRMAQTLSLEDA